MPDIDILRSLAEQVAPPAVGELHDVARRRTRRRAAAIAVPVVVAVVAAAVTGVLVSRGDDRSVGPAGPPDVVDDHSATSLSEVAAGVALRPGWYAMNVASEDADAPSVLLDVPPGFSTADFGGYEIVAEQGGFRHFGTWTVTEVTNTPCSGSTWGDPGPTVDDLVAALRSLPVWESSAPTPVTIDGHRGVVMDLDVPAALPARCREELHGWRDHLSGEQGVFPGKRHRLWIVDVDGHRVLLVAGYPAGPDGPDPRQVAALEEMAQRAEFVDPDDVGS